MPGFLKRHQKKIIWIVVLGFFVGGVGLVSLNQAGVFRRGTPTVDAGPAYAVSVNGETISREAAGNAFSNLLNQYYVPYLNGFTSAPGQPPGVNPGPGAPPPPRP